MKLEEFKAFNIYEGFQYLCDMEDFSDKHLIILPEKDFEDFNIKLLPDSYIIGTELKSPGVNENKSQFSKVTNHIFKGTKKWVSKYMLVWDSMNSTKLVTNKQFESKGEAVEEGRKMTELHKRRCYVILGKSPEGFLRAQAKIEYKPNQKQSLGLYGFKYKT